VDADYWLHFESSADAGAAAGTAAGAAAANVPAVRRDTKALMLEIVV